MVVNENVEQGRENNGGRRYTPKAAKSLSGHAPRRGMQHGQNGPGTPAEIRQHQRAARPHQRKGRPSGGRKKVNIRLKG